MTKGKEINILLLIIASEIRGILCFEKYQSREIASNIVKFNHIV